MKMDCGRSEDEDWSVLMGDRFSSRSRLIDVGDPISRTCTEGRVCGPTSVDVLGCLYSTQMSQARGQPDNKLPGTPWRRLAGDDPTGLIFQD